MEQPSRYKKTHCRQQAVDELLVNVFPEAQETPPEEIVLELDVTDLHLYIFAGEDLLCVRLRTAGQDAAAGAKEVVRGAPHRIRAGLSAQRPAAPDDRAPDGGSGAAAAADRPAQALYEELYCARGEMENRIKEQLSLFTTRVSAETMKANQVRLNLAGCGC